MIKITRDSNVDMKVLDNLSKRCLIDVIDIKIEDVPKRTRKLLPLGVFGRTKYGESVYGGEDTQYNDILKIIGKKNVGDAIKLEGHIRSGRDYFITDDKDDILNYRDILESKFNIKIINTKELIAICENM